MNGFRPLGPIRPYFAVLALTLSLAACERAAPSAAAPAEPAAPPDLSLIHI